MIPRILPRLAGRLVILLAFTLLACPHGHAQSLFDVNFGGARSHPFDVLHIAIDLHFDEGKKEVIGSVTHRIRSLAGDLRSVRLDAGDSMSFSRVEVDGIPAHFTHAGDTLNIDLPTPRHYNDSMTLRIDYRAYPAKGLYFIGPDSASPNRRRQIWTQGEAEDNHYWVPLYDYPNDRATSELTATVRGDWKVLSNGQLKSVTGNSDGSSTWHYVMEKPHAGYLIMMAAGDYLVTRDTVGSTPLEYWTYPDMPGRVATTFGRTPDMYRYFERLLGVPYPWNKYAQITIADFMYGGMENTTATTLNDYLLVDTRGRLDYNPDNTISHELAHQWFGDLVTNRSWGSLWLHESFATYLAARYIGYSYGDDEFQKMMYDNGRSGLESDRMQGRDPIANGKGHTANLYPRGARVLHMLNRLVGDSLFWRSCRLYLQRNGYGLAETNDLKLAVEDVTGLNLDWFFDEWVYKGGAPSLKVEESWSGDSVRLRVRQTQHRDSLTGLFSMPVPVEISLRDSIIRTTVWMSNEDQTFAIASPEKPRYLIFDAGDAMLKDVDFPRSDAELLAQLDAPRMIDRLLAVKALATPARKESKDIPAGLYALYQKEPSPIVREEIVNDIATFATPLSARIVALAVADTSVDVRHAAAEMSFLVADKSRRAELLRPLLSDSSRSVVMEAVGMMALTQPTGLEPILHGLAGIRGRRDRFAADWLSAAGSGKFNGLVDDIILYTAPGYTRITRSQAYRTLGDLDTTTAPMRQAIERGMRDTSEIVTSAAADAAEHHLDGEMREMLTRIRNEVPTKNREHIDRILSVQK